MTPEEQLAHAYRALQEAHFSLLTELDATAGPERGPLMQALWRCRRGDLNPLYLSQAGQDYFLDQQVFHEKHRGVFVEIGGYDGYTGSNSFFFEVFREWTGLLVEPVAERFKTARRIRRCKCLNHCVSDSSGMQEFIQITDGYTQMSGLRASYDESMLETVRANPVHREQSVEIRTRSLADILCQEQLSQIDCLFIDVEGAEEMILRNFPFDEFEIGACCIENMSGRPEIPRVMATAGYRLIDFIGMDEIYVAEWLVRTWKSE